ncbi:MAG TPA: acetoin utilization protein AcuC [Thermodesulfobacteriota bacterium]|nr:acetoin utilization protein AcuC [Thermodesulfobacteriota bacterium]
MMTSGDTCLLLYNEDYERFNYGPYHPLRVERLKLTKDLIEHYGLLQEHQCFQEKTRLASREEVLSFHTHDYWNILVEANSGICALDLSSYGLGEGDNPIFSGVLDWGCLTAGGALQAGEWVTSGRGSTAFHMAGGMHHAHRNKASGFCYINDPVLVILYLLAQGKKVAYIDIDAHHGDGVQEAFYRTNQVLTISFHQNGQTLFPSTGFTQEIGEGMGTGFAVNVPLYPWTDDEVFTWAFNEVVPPLLKAFAPEVIVTQLGVDSFYNDPLANLSLTTRGFTQVVRYFKGLNLPWVALGGGGYHMINVARAWTLAWSIMMDQELGQEKLPKPFREAARRLDFQEEWLRNEDFQEDPVKKERAFWDARRTVRNLKEMVFPLFNIYGGGWI